MTSNGNKTKRTKAKEPPPSKYEAWKADIIRARLNNYCLARATGRKPLPLRAVLEWMEACPTMDPTLLDQDGKIMIDEEWLRRFTHGTSGLIYERVDALRVFLIYEGFLSNEELNDAYGDHGEMLALHGYLGTIDTRARERLRALPDPCAITANRASDTETITLELRKSEELGLFFVEEVILSENRTLAHVRGVKDLKHQRQRRGYGFYSTRMTLLHIFLRGASPADRVHYIEVEPFISPEGASELYLVRIGLPWRSNIVNPGAPVFRGGTLTPQNCGVLIFAPPSAKPKQTTH